MSLSPNAPYLYLYVQSYRLAAQDQHSQTKTWNEHFYAPDDEEARTFAQTVLTMKNARAVIPYVETGLERSPQNVLVDYYMFAAIKERQPDGTYRAVYQREKRNECGAHVILE